MIAGGTGTADDSHTRAVPEGDLHTDKASRQPLSVVSVLCVVIVSLCENTARLHACLYREHCGVIHDRSGWPITSTLVREICVVVRLYAVHRVHCYPVSRTSSNLSACKPLMPYIIPSSHCSVCPKQNDCRWRIRTSRPLPYKYCPADQASP